MIYKTHWSVIKGEVASCSRGWNYDYHKKNNKVRVNLSLSLFIDGSGNPLEEKTGF